ncbi:MAG: PIN domain-containing protein [Bacteroidota bacterium]
MRLIVDTNILISTLLQPKSSIGELLLYRLKEVDKFAPHLLFVEIFDKKDKIAKYSKIEPTDLLELLFRSLKQITFINEHQIKEENWQKARELMQGVDPDDTVFVALALEMGATLWTGDKKLIQGLRDKGFSAVVSTTELDEHLSSDNNF